MTTQRDAMRKRARRPDQARRARDCARWKDAYAGARKRQALLGTIGRPFA